MIKNFWHPVVFSLLIASSSAPAITQIENKQGPAKKIEVGPIYEYARNIGVLGRSSRDANIRQFIWDHWNQKRKGRVAARFYSIDGPATTHSFQVTRDKAGKWILASRIEKSCNWVYALILLSRGCGVVILEEQYDIVERVMPFTTPRPFLGAPPDLESLGGDRTEVIPTSDTRPHHEYRLQFRSTSTALPNGLL